MEGKKRESRSSSSSTEGNKKIKLGQAEVERQLRVVMEWVRGQIDRQDVPRSADVVDYAKRELGFVHLTDGQITQALRLFPNYVMNSLQKRKKLRGDRNRPMIVSSLGELHGDIGFFAPTSDYEMKERYRAGFVVAKDTLSRFIFVAILNFNRKAPEMVKAFKNIFEQFRAQYPGHRVQSLAFDRERSVMSNLVQDFLREEKVIFTAFHNTSSKSKMAESAIKLVRTANSRLRFGDGKEKRWWVLIHPVVASLNSKPIRIRNKCLPMKNDGGGGGGGRFYTPERVTFENAPHFLKQLQKADASFMFSQYDIDPRFVTFKFKADDFVRPKLLATSSEVLGAKRSEVTLEDEIFVVDKCLPYVSRRNTIEKAYVCVGLTSNRKETFQEDEIALTPAPQ